MSPSRPPDPNTNPHHQPLTETTLTSTEDDPHSARDAFSSDRRRHYDWESAHDDGGGGGGKPTPLPILQLMSVYLVQFGEPVTATVIYPFINRFVHETGITEGDEGRTGYYAGLIESAFFLSECLTVVLWGYFADRFGRRPVLLCAPLGLAFSMLMFGSSSSLWALLGSRFMQGVFNGNIGVAKTIIAEMTDASNRAAAYGFMPVVWNSGITLGPLLGGFLSNPGERWPILGQVPYLKAHPYSLPCFASALLIFLIFVFSSLTLRETLPSLVVPEIAGINPSSEENHLIRHTAARSYGTHDQKSLPALPKIITAERPIELEGLLSLATPPVFVLMLNSTFLAFMEMAHVTLLPLMYSTSVEHGGLGLDPYHIGLVLGNYGLCNSIFQAISFGRLVQRYGERGLYVLASRNLVLCVAMYPLISFFAWRAQRVDGCVAVCVFLQLCFQTSTSLAYGAMQLLIIDHNPKGAQLGVTTGVAQMIGSGMRTVAPSVASSLFAFSVTQRGLLGGGLVYYVLIAIGLLGYRSSWLLPEGKPANSKLR